MGKYFAVVCGVAFLAAFTVPMASQVANQQRQQPKPTATPQTPPKPQPVADAKVPLIDRPLTLADFAGMEPRPELKDKLTHLTNFIQNQPTDGGPATENTEV